MTPERKWDYIETRFGKGREHKDALEKLASSGVPAPFLNTVTDVAPRGILQQMQAWNAERKARVRIFTDAMQTQVRVWQERIQAGEALAKEHIRNKLHEAMQDLKQQHLQTIQASDRQTIEQSANMVQEVAIRMADRLYEANQLDLPKPIKDKLLDTINRMYDSLWQEIEGGVGSGGSVETSEQ